MLIDRVMPTYDVSEHHQLRVLAPSDVTYEAAHRLDLARSKPVRALFVARGIPRLVRTRRLPERSMTVDDLVRGGFVLLAEDPGTEFVLGVVGQFWKPTGKVRRIVAEEFADYSADGDAKAAWNFRVEPRGDDRSVVFTETRVRCTDDDVRRRFLLYWAAIGPFSGFVRRQSLRLIKADAEREAGGSGAGPTGTMGGGGGPRDV